MKIANCKLKISCKGEIATVLTIGTLIIIGVASLVSSVFLSKSKQTTKTKAAVDCQCQWQGGDYIWQGNQCKDNSGKEHYGESCTYGKSFEEVFGSGSSTTTSSCPGKLDQIGACNPACCQTDDDCKGPANQPQPQVCGVPNGYCLSGKSCAAVEPTSKEAKYVRMCLGASCSWTFCDGQNVNPSICTKEPYTATNSDPSTLCDSNEECQTFKPTSAPGVDKCINPLGKQETCPRTYPQCYGNGKAVIVHLDCTQSNTSGCVYWCESKSGGRTGCDKSDVKTFDEPSCKAAALPTVTPTPAGILSDCQGPKICKNVFEGRGNDSIYWIKQSSTHIYSDKECKNIINKTIFDYCNITASSSIPSNICEGKSSGFTFCFNSSTVGICTGGGGAYTTQTCVSGMCEGNKCKTVPRGAIIGRCTDNFGVKIACPKLEEAPHPNDPNQKITKYVNCNSGAPSDPNAKCDLFCVYKNDPTKRAECYTGQFGANTDFLWWGPVESFKIGIMNLSDKPVTINKIIVYPQFSIGNIDSGAPKEISSGYKLNPSENNIWDTGTGCGKLAPTGGRKVFVVYTTEGSDTSNTIGPIFSGCDHRLVISIR